MAYRPGEIGGGYPRSVMRVEYRPGLPPEYPTRDGMMRLLEDVVESGAEAWWYSCAGKGSYPLFPSKYLPHVPEAEAGLFEWFTDQCHQRGIIIMSWEYLSTSPLTTREHPDWRMEFLQPSDGGRPGRPERHAEVYGDQNPTACFNSPYGELLMDYSVEVIQDLGFDGIWFDGCFMGPANTWPGGSIGCCCPRCARQFRDEIGLQMPTREDWSSEAFRRFIRWRQRFFADYWRRLCQHVRAHSPTGLIGLNNFNRWPHSTGFGCPLNPVDFDGLSCAEVSQQPWQALLMLKYLRQVAPRHPPELWIRHTPPGPGGGGEQMAYFGELCMTAGGFHSAGSSLSPGHLSRSIRAAGDELRPRAEWVCGQPLRFAGLVLSSNTKDFAFEGDSEPTWRSVHGMHNLLLDAHWPSEVILDDQMTPEHLRFPLVICSEVRCLSDTQAAALRAYVEGGGTLLVTGQIGALDEIGRPRPAPALDGLLGVERRDRRRPPEHVVAPDGGWAAGLSSPLRLWPGEAAPSAIEDDGAQPVAWADDTRVLAWGVRCADDSAEEPVREHAAITCRKVGEGHVIAFDRDIGGFYSHEPRPEWRRVAIACLRQFVVPPVEIDAAPHVAVTLWWLGGRLVAHILSRPHQLRVVGHQPCVDLSDVPPAGAVRLTLSDRVSSAERPVTGDPLEIDTDRGRSIVKLPFVGRHDVLVMEIAAD